MPKKVSKVTIIAATAAIGLSSTAIALYGYSTERSATVRAAVSDSALPGAPVTASKMIVADDTKKVEG